MSAAISIIICTRNNRRQLAETLRAVERLTIPSSVTAELVVVDNGSTDGTGRWLQNERLSNMPIRAVEEPRPGQARARNAGIAAASGEIILFTDDDVVLPENWLQEMCRPLLAGQADAVRGKSTLAAARNRPWMQGFHRAVLAVTEGIDEGGRSDMVGLSMGFSRRVLKRVPEFDPELGPGTANGFFDDTLFAKQILAAGFRVCSVVAAPVVHVPDVRRLTRRSFLEAARCRGRALAYVAYHWHHRDEYWWTRRRTRWSVWRHPWLVLAKRWLNLWTWRLRHPRELFRTEGIAYREFALVNQFEQMRQYLRLRRGPRNYDRHGLVKRHGVLPRRVEARHEEPSGVEAGAVLSSS